MTTRRSGFTLVEILVVLGIIALLAALLFPAFGRARENGRQTACVTNLQQISLAVQQYRKDEGYYPNSLVQLLGEGAKYDDGTPTGTPLGNNAPGYLKSGQDSLVCLSDDTDAQVPRSSYSALFVNAPPTPLAQPIPTTFVGDFAQYTWNYYGYRSDGFAYKDAAEAGTGTWSVAGTHPGSGTAPATAALLVNPAMPYNHRLGGGNYDATKAENPIKFSLANRFALPSTIVTHCVYHRVPTANGLNSPGELYADPNNSGNARDIVLRVDGSTKTVDVSQWSQTSPNSVWQKQTQ